MAATVIVSGKHVRVAGSEVSGVAPRSVLNLFHVAAVWRCFGTEKVRLKTCNLLSQAKSHVSFLFKTYVGEKARMVAGAQNMIASESKINR